MQSLAPHPSPAALGELTWLPVITVAYHCEHPEGYRSCITPAESGGFIAHVEIPGLIRRYAPRHLSSLSAAQAWCCDRRRLLELKQMA